MPGQHKPVGARPISQGRNDNKSSLLLLPGESPDALNVDFDRGSVRAAGGAVKFNNQTAPRPGVLTGIPGKNGYLPVLPGKSVPIRGAVYQPYRDRQDLGGDYVEDILTAAAPYNRYWHRRRGREFDLQVSFRIPEDELLFASETKGKLTNIASGATWDTRFGADLALDEFFAIVQKGGDRFTPMSWALGIVNTGRLFDIDVGGGLNIFGVSTATYANRRSNYCLCFMWLDAPGVGIRRPVQMRYRLTNGSVWSDETVHVAASDGAYSTLAYRAVIAPFFVELGRNYSTAVRLTLDTGTPGTAFNATTGETSGVAWNNNGSVEIRCARDFEASESFLYSQASPGASTLFRYKGPTDSLDYLTKYGVRYSGADAMHLGLGMRYASWASAGFVPFGIDSCPWESGGFRISDHSVMGPTASSLYGEYADPEKEASAGNGITQLYDLQIAHNSAGVGGDSTGTLFEIKQPGLVRQTAATGHDWGNETLRWAGTGPQGKNPWSPYDSPWAGLGGDPAVGVGFNAEALRSYRLVFLAESSGAGFHAQQAVGGLLSIGSYVATAPYADSAYSQHIVAEGGDQFLNASNPDFGPAAPAHYALSGQWFVGVRAFRWNQRKIVVSDLRLHAKVRTWSDIAEFYLTHELDPDDSNAPGQGDLVLHLPLTDGGGTLIEERIASNHAFFTPMAVTSLADLDGERGGVFLSGEGEALSIDFSENGEFRQQLLDAFKNPSSGIAIQMRMVLPEAYYGMTQRVNDPFGQTGANSLYKAKFAPPLAVWDFRNPERSSDTGSTLTAFQVDSVSGHQTRPQPVLEFGHNVEVENNVGVEPTLYPLGFSLKTLLQSDQREVTAGVPGSAATGLHAWYQSGGVNVNRWSSRASWVGREIVVQFGLHPTGTADQYKVYIAAWPKEHLNPAANDAPNSEFAYFATATVYRRDLLRSVVVIGGAWNPRHDEKYDASLTSFQAIGKAMIEANARVILKSVTVFGASTAGDLPSVTGGIVPVGTGKVVGRAALPPRQLEEDDILHDVAPGSGQLNVTKGSFSAAASGGALFSTAAPYNSPEAVDRTFIHVLGETEEEPVATALGVTRKKTYFVTAATTTALTLNRPYTGPTRKATPAKSFRIIAHTDLADDLRDRQLGVGRGRGYSLGSVTAQDAAISDQLFSNLSPVGVGWRLRVYSALASGGAQDLWPKWTRGVGRSARNKILGIGSLNTDIFAAAQGSLFLADDRWRRSGPTTALTKSFKFLSREDPSTGVLLPEASDFVIFSSMSNVNLVSGLLDNAGALTNGVFDAWVHLDAHGPIQTVGYAGRLDTDPTLAAGTAGLQWWWRFSNGYPEFVVGSTALSGGANPTRGLFIARGSLRIRKGAHVHIRWVHSLNAIGGSIAIPSLFVNGKLVTVTVNATDDSAAAGYWIGQSTITTSGASRRLMIGCARDAYQAPLKKSEIASPTNAAEFPTQPQLLTGFIHSLAGSISGLVVARETPSAAFSTTLNFNHRAISYTTRRFSALESNQTYYGVGHRMYDAGLDAWGTIYSHPFISLSHELGRDANPVSFANYQDKTFVANGGRVGVVQDRAFRFAGLLAPSSKPKVEVVREPLWKANQFVTAGDADNSLTYKVNHTNTTKDFTDPATTRKVYHYNNPGTQYLRQASDASMAWVADSYFGFKCYFRLRRVSGRIPIFSRRDSLSSGGPFIEVRDGFVYAGWWDTSLKKEVWVRTSKPIIQPGYDYYLYYRKFFPRGGLNTGHNAFYTPSGSNWAHSLPVDDGSSVKNFCYDSLVVRRFNRAAHSVTDYFDWTGYDAKTFVNSPTGLTNYDYSGDGSSPRACVSFTLADISFGPTNPYTLAQPYHPTGFVMFDIAIDNASVGAGSDELSINPAGVALRFTHDHVGMLIQVQAGTFDNQVYRIVEFLGALKVRVRAPGGAPGLTIGGLAGARMSVFTGVSLVKSESYDLATSPDSADYAVELFGSSLSANPLNGVAPFDGEFYGYAYGIFTYDGSTVDGGSNKVGRPNIFENATTALGTAPERIASANDIGTDVFGLQGSTNPLDGKLPAQGVPAGELQVDATFARTAVDTAPYHAINFGVGATAAAASAPDSTQPNAAREHALDAASTGALKPVFTTTNPVTAGVRLSQITHYDPRTAVESYPGEQFSVDIPEEDDASPSASVRLLYSEIPAPLERSGISTRIYLSEAAGDDLFLRVQVDDDGMDSVAVPIDDVAAVNLALLDPDALGAPPRGHYLAVSQARLCLGRLDGQGDGVAFSTAYAPEVFPLANVFPVDTGDADVTGLRDLLGTLVVFKRRVMAFYLFDDFGQPKQVRTIRGDGCVSHASISDLDDRIYLMSERGPMVLLGVGEAQFIGRRMQNYMREEIDPSCLAEISSTINRLRNQYVFTVRRLGTRHTDERFAVEYDAPIAGETQSQEIVLGHRLALYEGPTCTALGSVENGDGGPALMVGGTHNGFMVWMDRTDARMLLSGPLLTSASGPLWGDRTVLIGGAALTGTLDTALEGPMGQLVRYYSAGEVERLILFSVSGATPKLYLDGPTQEAYAWLIAQGQAVGATVAVGSMRARWSTKDIDDGSPQDEKHYYFLDVSRAIKTGQLYVDCFRNMAALPTGTRTLDLTQSFSADEMGSIIQQARAARFLFRTQTPAVDVDFELFDVVARLGIHDNR